MWKYPVGRVHSTTDSLKREWWGTKSNPPPPPHHHHYHQCNHPTNVIIFHHPVLAWAKKLHAGNSPNMRKSLPHIKWQTNRNRMPSHREGNEQPFRFLLLCYSSLYFLVWHFVLIILGHGSICHNCLCWSGFLCFTLLCSIWRTGGWRVNEDRTMRRMRRDTISKWKSFTLWGWWCCKKYPNSLLKGKISFSEILIFLSLQTLKPEPKYIFVCPLTFINPLHQ